MKKRLVSTLCALALAATAFTSPVYASDYEFNQESDLSNPVAVTVTATIASEYTLAIPKSMVLTRNEEGIWSHEYTIDVNGYICEDQTLNVAPQSNEILLSSDGKEDVPIIVSQPVQKIKSIDYTGSLDGITDTVLLDATENPEITGSLTVKDGYRLSAGSWEGTLTFNISVDEESTP